MRRAEFCVFGPPSVFERNAKNDTSSVPPPPHTQHNIASHLNEGDDDAH